MALATGGRISEIHTLLRLDENVVYLGEGITLYPNPTFLTKSKDPGNRHDPIFIDERVGEVVWPFLSSLPPGEVSVQDSVHFFHEVVCLSPSDDGVNCP